MFKWREFLRLYRLRRTDFLLALVAFLGVLTFAEALWALLLAVVLSLLALVWRTSQGRMTELGLAPGNLAFEEVGAGSGAVPIGGLLIYAPEESLFFANADTVRVQITNHLAASPEPISGVLLDMELTNELDVPSADMLKELHDDLASSGVQLQLARVRPAVRDLLERSGVTAAIGEERIYNRVLEGVLMHLSVAGTDEKAFLGLSSDLLKRLQQAVNDMLGQVEGPQREELAAVAAQLGKAIAEMERG
jgi:MFS superfamily sulfate permease-like transporter